MRHSETRYRVSTGAIFAALSIIAAIAFTPASLALPNRQLTVGTSSPDGLTAHGINNARVEGLLGSLVAMAPQSSLKVLSQATLIRPHAPKAMIELTVGLKLRHVEKLKQFLQEAQYPASPKYHQWLTPEQFTARYGPSKADVAEVVKYLESHGITVQDISANRILIHTRATTAVYEHAFHVRINDYKMNGRSFYSTSDSPLLPKTLAPLVTNVIGLNHAAKMRPHSYFRPLSNAHGLSSRTAPAASLTHLNPLQIAKAYNYPDITDPSNGQNVHIAILTAASSGLSSLGAPHVFWAAYGLPDHKITIIPVDGDKGNAGGMSETLLDVEYSGAMGPGAILDVYVANDAFFPTFVDMYNQFVEDNIADVMTTSWGHPESGSALTTNQIFMQAAAQGIAMFAAAGDGGSGDGIPIDNLADFPSSSPYITASNGTQLTISDLEGHYDSEVVWNDETCFGFPGGATGGAISFLFDKPAWQRGPGVPSDVTMRMNSGIALTASCSHPMYVMGDEWSLTAGTSAVAPQLAGLFAIATAVHGGRLGQANKLIYGDARNHYSSDFHDITEGNNGAYEAKPNWDHPTGWGSVNAKNLIDHLGIQGPKGMLVGIVTDAANGASVAGALVIAQADDGATFKATTRPDGTFKRVLPVGSYTVIASYYGYRDGTASVSITNKQTTTQDLSLSLSPKVELSGMVKDGSGHKYPLYAHVNISVASQGQVASLWTNPGTGQYSVELPQDETYTVRVAAAFDGYEAISNTFKLSASKSDEDFALSVNGTCVAPGYVGRGISADFNGSTFPPDGWAVTNAVDGSPVIWKLDTDWRFQENWTGGTGTAADIDSGADSSYMDPHDSSLVTPPVSASAVRGGSTVLYYKANFQANVHNDTLDLDISMDGGATWKTIVHWKNNHGKYFSLPGETVHVDLAPYLPAKGTFKLRWRDYDYSTVGNKGWDFYAQIDDVAVGGCKAVPGSIVYGEVKDAKTGKGVPNATITDDMGSETTTLANKFDPNLADTGFYMFFVRQGARTLTAQKGNYAPATKKLSIADDKVVQQDFTLKGPRFESNPDTLDVHVKAHSSGTTSFALVNAGEAGGKFTIKASEAALPDMDNAVVSAIMPVRHVNGNFDPASSVWLQAHGQIHGYSTRSERFMPRSSEWTDIQTLPYPLQDNAGAADSATGVIYSIGGFNGTANVSTILAYDPNTSNWQVVAEMPVTRGAPVAVFLDGQLYVVNGFGLDGGKPVATLDIFDPDTGDVLQGADNPVPAAGGSAAAVVDGKWYVVGGCDDGSCAAPLATVQVYDPVTDSWNSAPDYPHPVSFAACGGVDGKLYCAGGSNVDDEYSGGYVFNPATPKAGWSPIADIPVDSGGLWGSGYSAANGKLLVSGGITNNFKTMTNEGYAYDPATDSWSDLPNASITAYRGASACGFYRYGGADASNTPTWDAAMLPGYAQCGRSAGVEWMTVAPSKGTLEKGQSARIVLTFDGSDHEKFTASKAHLKVIGGLGEMPVVPITVHWDAPPVDLEVLGNVSPTGEVHKDDTLTYSITVQNLASAEDTATQVQLSYEIPDGVSYLASNGAQCAVPSAGSSSGAIPAAVEGPATVLCDLGTMAPDTGKLVNLSVQATTDADTVSGTFTASAREPDSDTGNNSLALSTNPAVGPPGPTGPTGTEGPKGDKGSGGLGWLALAVLLGLALGGIVIRERRKQA